MDNDNALRVLNVIIICIGVKLEIIFSVFRMQGQTIRGLNGLAWDMISIRL